MDRLSATVPFPLRERKMQSMSGITLSMYKNIANMPLVSRGYDRMEMVDGGMAIVSKYADSLVSLYDLVMGTLRSHYNSDVRSMVSNLAHNVHRFNLEGSGNLTCQQFSLAMRASLSTPPSDKVVDDVFSCFAVANSDSRQCDSSSKVDAEMLLGILSYWAENLVPKQSPAYMAQKFGSREPQSTIKRIIHPNVYPADVQTPSRVPPKPRHLGVADGLPLQYTTPSSAVSVLKLLNERIDSFKSVCLKLTTYSKTDISLDELRLCMTHCKIGLTPQQWLSFKEFARSHGILNPDDQNRADVLKLLQVCRQLDGASPPAPSDSEYFFAANLVDCYTHTPSNR